MKLILQILLYIWQLPQNLVGLLVRLICKGEKKITIGSIVVYYLSSFPGGISLGSTIMVGTQNEFTAKHERGHQIQSKYLGPLYLLVIGLPSFIWAILYTNIPAIKHRWSYYVFYPERWADKLGGVTR